MQPSRRARGNELRGLVEFTWFGTTADDIIIIPTVSMDCPMLRRKTSSPMTRMAAV
jgi:hypothetical protein